jgi:hypothetical protein
VSGSVSGAFASSAAGVATFLAAFLAAFLVAFLAADFSGVPRDWAAFLVAVFFLAMAYEKEGVTHHSQPIKIVLDLTYHNL